VAGFVALQLAICAVTEVCQPDLTDPEFGRRLALLEARLRESGDRPLLLLVGSSRCVCAFRPEILPPVRTASGRRALVFNFAHSGSGPVLNLILVDRLLRKDVHPRWLFVEVMPPYLCYEGLFQRILQVGDLPAVACCTAAVRRYGKNLLQRLAGGLGGPQPLAHYYAPAWFPGPRSPHYFLGPLGGLEGPRRVPPAAEIDWLTAVAYNQYQHCLHDFRIARTADRALRALLDRCRRQRIRVALLLMPEGSAFRNWYPPRSRRLVDAYLADLSRAYRVPVIDARRWLPDGQFADSHHVLPAGADAFTRRFGREALVPLLGHGGQLPESKPGPELAWQVARGRRATAFGKKNLPPRSGGPMGSR
jgi:hypothetical protein